MKDLWFLLYAYGSDGYCDDCEGMYVGRTTDIEQARMHVIEVNQQQYSSGYVEIISDTLIFVAPTLEWFEELLERIQNETT